MRVPFVYLRLPFIVTDKIALCVEISRMLYEFLPPFMEFFVDAMLVAVHFSTTKI